MEGVLLLVFLSADKPSDAAVKEFAALRGTWRIVSAEDGGKRVTADDVYLGAIKSVRFTDEKPKRLESRCDLYTVAFDPSASPKRLTGTIPGGAVKGDKMPGIYRLDGDKLTICWEYGAKAYPTEFKSGESGGRVVLHLERLKE
jgi:uncharacterized protein (TIGR03067 family)